MKRRVIGKVSKENPSGERFGGSGTGPHLFRRANISDCSRSTKWRRNLAQGEARPGTQH